MKILKDDEGLPKVYVDPLSNSVTISCDNGITYFRHFKTFYELQIYIISLIITDQFGEVNLR